MIVKLSVYRSWSQITVITKEVDFDDSDWGQKLIDFVGSNWADVKQFKFNDGVRTVECKW